MCVPGTVEAFSSLDCEVVFYPSFGSSKTTQFALHVEGGNQPKLLCQAQVLKKQDYLETDTFQIRLRVTLHRYINDFKSS